MVSCKVNFSRQIDVFVCKALFSNKLCWKQYMIHSNDSKLCMTHVEQWSQKVICSHVSVKLFGLCICPEEKETLMKSVQPFGESFSLPIDAAHWKQCSHPKFWPLAFFILFFPKGSWRFSLKVILLSAIRICLWLVIFEVPHADMWSIFSGVIIKCPLTRI